MATHSSILAWRIPGTGEPGGLPTMGSHRVGHDWSDLAAAAVSNNMVYKTEIQAWGNIRSKKNNQQHWRKRNQIILHLACKNSLVNKTLTQFRGYLACLGSNPHVPTYCICEFWQIINTLTSVLTFLIWKMVIIIIPIAEADIKLKEIVNVKYKVQCFTRYLCSKNDGYFSLIIGVISY